MCNVFSIKSFHFLHSYSASCCSLSQSVFVHFVLFLLDYLKIWFALLFSNLFICVNETCILSQLLQAASTFKGVGSNTNKKKSQLGDLILHTRPVLLALPALILQQSALTAPQLREMEAIKAVGKHGNILKDERSNGGIKATLSRCLPNH